MKMLVSLLFLLLTGCAVTHGPPFSVSVSSFARTGVEAKKSFIILPAEEGRSVQDLEFLEFATYVERALTSRGLQKASDFISSDLAVFLSFGIGEPKEHTYTYSLPVWGQTGVASSTTRGNVNVFGNTATYSQSTTNIPQYGVTGHSSHEGSYTTFNRHVSLTAYDLVEFRNNKSETVIWETRIASTGSSGDLRRVVPILIAAASPYFGISTGKIIKVSLYESDPSVLEVKGLPVAADKKIK